MTQLEKLLQGGAQDLCLFVAAVREYYAAADTGEPGPSNETYREAQRRLNNLIHNLVIHSEVEPK